MEDHEKSDLLLFWACFFALVATAFAFIVRAQIIGDWETQFNLTETQKGEILGVGLWPFALSIVLFSLVIDKVGYGKAMLFAFLCQVVSAVSTIYAKDYDTLYSATFIGALGNGTVEAVVNPVVATMFVKEKTKWLNILHASWPGGMVLGGMLAIYLGDVGWEWKVGLIFIPMAVYAVLFLLFLAGGSRFPLNERVAAGVGYRDMLKEAGYLGAFIMVALMVTEVWRVFEIDNSMSEGIGAYARWGVIFAITGAYGAYVRSPGRPMFLFLLLVMIPLATTELGTDSWITDLMTPVMTGLGFHPGWVLIYTSVIMMFLRFYAGPIVNRLSPLGLLAVSSAVACVGLLSLSVVETGLLIFVSATVYGFGKTFFWPTMLGVASEQFPKGGALTLNMIGAMGNLGSGIVGLVFLGYIQDISVDKVLQTNAPEIRAEVAIEKVGVFGDYTSIDQEKLEALSEGQHEELEAIQATAKKGALATVAIFPAIMLVCYLILIFYFRSKGGYRAKDLVENAEGGGG